MKANMYGIQPNWKPDPDVEQLVELIDYSRQHPEKFDYQEFLNAWQAKLAISIYGLSKHVEQFTPTQKQKIKTVECLETIRIGLTRRDELENSGSAS